MPVCRVCFQAKSKFLLNNQLVCLECDELLLDLEIERDGGVWSVTHESVTEQPDKDATRQRQGDTLGTQRRSAPRARPVLARFSKKAPTLPEPSKVLPMPDRRRQPARPKTGPGSSQKKKKAA